MIVCERADVYHSIAVQFEKQQKLYFNAVENSTLILYCSVVGHEIIYSFTPQKYDVTNSNKGFDSTKMDVSYLLLVKAFALLSIRIPYQSVHSSPSRKHGPGRSSIWKLSWIHGM